MDNKSEIASTASPPEPDAHPRRRSFLAGTGKRKGLKTTASAGGSKGGKKRASKSSKPSAEADAPPAAAAAPAAGGP